MTPSSPRSCSRKSVYLRPGPVNESPSPTCPFGLGTSGIRHHSLSTPLPLPVSVTRSLRKPEKEADPGGPCQPSSEKFSIPHQPGSCRKEMSA
jgi:hypothetical protein